jgi:hypothetical protein
MSVSSSMASVSTGTSSNRRFWRLRPHQGIGAGEDGTGQGRFLAVAEVEIADLVAAVLVELDAVAGGCAVVFVLADDFDQALEARKTRRDTWLRFIRRSSCAMLSSVSVIRIGRFGSERRVARQCGTKLSAGVGPQHAVEAAGDLFFAGIDQHRLFLGIGAASSAQAAAILSAAPW